jgi:hypothetical protein
MSNENKVYLNYKINFTSKANIDFAFTVIFAHISFYLNVEFLAEFLITIPTVLPPQPAEYFFPCLWYTSNMRMFLYIGKNFEC